MTDYNQQLAGFLAGLRYQDLPPAVLARMEELFLDWPTVARRSCPAGGAARRISPPW